MSHFPVLVSVPNSKNVDDMLMPFHEFECTGIDRFIQDIDNTTEVQEEIDKNGLQSGLEYFGLDGRVVTNEVQIDTSNAHKYGYAVVVDGKLIKAVDRTNPNKRWDWYTIGGRWSGYFGRDEGTKSEMNFDAIRQEYIARKIDTYRKFHAALSEISVTQSDIDQARTLLDGRWKDNEKAQELYTHPVQLAFDERAFDKIDWHMWNSDDAADMHLSEDEYRAKYEWAAPLHAFIDTAGAWNEIDEMGWFAACAKENADKFNGKDGAFWSFINELPDDTMLYIVDCHI